VATATRRQGGKPGATPFDFRRPNKFNRDHVRALQIVHETFARQLSTVIATTLRAVSQVSLTSVEQLTYDEYVRSLPNPSFMVILSLNPLPGAAVFQLPLPIVFAAIDRLLGGTGDSLSPKRPLTEIESNLMRGLMDRALRELEYAYETLVHGEAEVVQQEFNPQFVQIAAPSDMAMAVSFETRIGAKRGTSSLCIPYTTMQPVLETLVSQHLFADRSHRDPVQWANALEDAVSSVPVEIAVRFGSVALTSREIVDLQVGDVVPLEHPVDRPLTVSVDDVPCYEAVTGRRGKHLACLIVGDADRRGW
jgi:flagellar motor switch protein FliM